MDDSNIRQNNDDIDGNYGMYESPNVSSGNVNVQGQVSKELYINSMKYYLLLGAEKLLMARNSPGKLTFCNMDLCTSNQNISAVGRQGKNGMQLNEKGYEKSQDFVLQSRTNQEIECNNEYFQSSRVIDNPSNYYNEFPLDFVSFLRILTVLALKLAGFQIGLFATFFTLPVQIFNIWVSFLLFPFHAVVFAREYLKKKLLTLWSYSCFSLIYFICDRFKMPKSVLKLAIRFCWAFFWSIYVCLILVGMLIMGFVIGGIIMRNLVVEPIQTTENLNFDYTKTSPVSFVHIASSPVAGISPAALRSKDRIPVSRNAAGRPIPYNHKLQLTVSLTMPESQYNRNLGIFQVKVESLSMDGKVTASSSYPSMLKFKSPSIRIIETIFKSIPLLTGFQSEVQELRIQVNDYTEGQEPTGCFKVSIEQRAEYEPGHGIPEIYSAALHIESQLPQSKRMIWNWRRSLFVWMSTVSFIAQLVVALIFFRPVILPGRTMLKVIGAKGSRYGMNKIAW